MPIQDLHKGKHGSTTARGESGMRWRVYWNDPETGKRRTKSFPKRDGKDPNTCAKAFDAQMQAKINAGTYVDPKAGNITVREYAEEWLATLTHDPATHEKYKSGFRLYVFPHLGHFSIGAVRASHIRGWMKARSEELAPNTVRNVYIPLKAMFVAAIEDGKRANTPCAKSIKLPDVEPVEHFVPVVGQVMRLAERVAPRFALAILLAAFCGLRAGEIMGLERGDIDLDAGTVRVRRAIKKVSGTPVYLDHPKTAESSRVVDLPAIVAVALVKHLDAGFVTEVELPDNTVKRKPGTPMVVRSATLLFTTATGKPVTSAHWTYYWCKARAAVLGLPATFGIHGLRHYFGTLLIHGGRNVKQVQKLMGHATPMITLNVYVHDWPGDDLSTRDLIAAAVGKVAA